MIKAVRAVTSPRRFIDMGAACLLKIPVILLNGFISRILNVICKNMTSTIVGTVTVRTVNPSHAYMAWVPPVHEATGGHAVLTVTVPTIFCAIDLLFCKNKEADPKGGISSVTQKLPF